MNREIPGFYYDPEKKKYFSIQASHKAAPGAQYSKDAVKRKRIEQEKTHRKHRQNTKLSKEKIKKAPFLSHPLIGCTRELGTYQVSQPIRRQEQGLTYTSHLHRKKVHRFEPWPDEYSIKHVVRNQRSGVLIASGYRGGESSVSICFPDLDQEKWTYNRTMERVLFKEPYRLSSISLSHTGYLLTTMDSGPNGDSFLAPRMLPDPDEGGDYRWPSAFTHPIRIRTNTSLWSSASCPAVTGPKPLFAIGTSNGLHTLTGLGSHWALNQISLPSDTTHPSGRGRGKSHKRRPDSSQTTVTSVEWLSGDVIAAGLKDSTVFLHDVRSGGSATRLRHDGAVSRIKKVDEWRVVIGGVNSLHMYDLRYPRTDLQRPKPVKNNRHHNNNRNQHNSTKPYLVFQDYSPNIIPEFDLSPELGILASASDDNSLQLFSLLTGEQVSSSPSPLSRYRYPKGISSLCFESSDKGVQGPQTPGLLVCSGDGVDEWRW